MVLKSRKCALKIPANILMLCQLKPSEDAITSIDFSAEDYCGISYAAELLGLSAPQGDAPRHVRPMEKLINFGWLQGHVMALTTASTQWRSRTCLVLRDALITSHLESV